MTGESDSREIRVRIGSSYHRRLQLLKTLRNKNMGDAIEEALDLYFSNVAPEFARV